VTEHGEHGEHQAHRKHQEQGVFLAVDDEGLAHLHVCGDRPAIARFHALVREEAAKLAVLGDTSPLGVRMTRALGVIADRLAALDLTADSQVAWWGQPRVTRAAQPSTGALPTGRTPGGR
jgi:hypothetical protein